MSTSEPKDLTSEVRGKVREGALDGVKDLSKNVVVWGGGSIGAGLMALAYFAREWAGTPHQVLGWVVALPWVLSFAALGWALWLRAQPKELRIVYGGSRVLKPEPSPIRAFRWQESGDAEYKPVFYGTLDTKREEVVKLRICCPGHTAPVDVEPRSTGANSSWSTTYQCVACGRRLEGALLMPEEHKAAIRRKIVALFQAGQLALDEPPSTEA